MNIKVKWLVWAVVILFLTNAATVGTIIYHNYRQEKSIDSTVIAKYYGGNAINGKFFRQTLGFTNEQMDIFRSANQQFRPQTLALTASIDSAKADMFKEMQNQQPDTLRLNELSKKIGDLHAALKLETYQFYLKIKAICSTQQKTQLEKAFEPLFINEDLTGTRGNRKGWNKAIN